MVFFGHLGLTTGIIKCFDKTTRKKINLNYNSTFDYRMVLLGSILPDLIDKPIGAFFFRSTFHNTRIFAHTLLFSALLILLGLFLLIKKKNNSILLLGTGAFIHLILDSMWLYPGILLWPYFGLKFPVRTDSNWLGSDFYRLIHDPSYYIPEIIGFIIIAYYFFKLIKNKKIKEFLFKGNL